MAARTYTTISGQTWDQIAYELYGDEHLCDAIMDANRELLEYFMFPAGIVLQIPEKESMVKAVVSSNYPEWRAMSDG